MKSNITKTADGFAVEFVNSSFGYKTVYAANTLAEAEALVAAKNAESQIALDQILTIDQYFYGVK